MIYVTGAEQGLGKAILEARPPHIGGLCMPREILFHNDEIIDWIESNVNPDYASFSDGMPIWVNNFGVNGLSWIGQTPEDEADRILHFNMIVPYLIVNALVAKFSATPFKIINISSIAHRVPMRCSTLYCASKAGLVQMTRVMARELAPRGWIVNCFCPGPMVDTNMLTKTKEQVMELRGWTKEYADSYALGSIPMHRESTTEETAQAIWRLIEMPDYVNGAIVEMGGGV